MAHAGNGVRRAFLQRAPHILAVALGPPRAPHLEAIGIADGLAQLGLVLGQVVAGEQGHEADLRRVLEPNGHERIGMAFAELPHDVEVVEQLELRHGDVLVAYFRHVCLSVPLRSCGCRYGR